MKAVSYTAEMIFRIPGKTRLFGVSWFGATLAGARAAVQAWYSRSGVTVVGYRIRQIVTSDVENDGIEAFDEFFKQGPRTT